MCNFSELLRFAAFFWVPVTVVMELMEILSPGIIIPLLQSRFFHGKKKKQPFFMKILAAIRITIKVTRNGETENYTTFYTKYQYMHGSVNSSFTQF